MCIAQAVLTLPVLVVSREAIMHDQTRWSLPFGAVIVEGVETDLRTAVEPQGLERSRLKVGDRVGFRDRQNQDRYGQVMALNPKTATILTSDQQRVAYQFLFPVIDSCEASTCREAPCVQGH